MKLLINEPFDRLSKIVLLIQHCGEAARKANEEADQQYFETAHANLAVTMEVINKQIRINNCIAKIQEEVVAHIEFPPQVSSSPTLYCCFS